MASLHPSELDSDSVASSPRSEYAPHDPRVRFMCSFGGKILPRPHDNQLRYVGGDTRIVAIHRSTTYSTLLTKLSKLSGITDVTVKYQLPNEDLDALISVTTDEDVENMTEEYDRVSHNQNPRSARLRLFLFAKGEDSRVSSISSLLGSANRENWFFDALNSGSRLERGRSEVSSIISEVPDYLFGLDNSDDAQVRDQTKIKNRHVLHDNVSASDPGSPAPVVSSPYCSTSSAVPIVPSIPDLPPVKTKPDNPEPLVRNPVEGIIGSQTIEPPVMQQTGFPGKTVLHYVPDPHYSSPAPMQQVPIYYVPAGPIPRGNVPVQSVPVRAPYQVQQYQIPTGQIPMGYHPQVPGMCQVYGAGMNQLPAMDQIDPKKVIPDGMNQQAYYVIRNASQGAVQVQMYPGSPQRGGSDPRPSRISQ